MGNLRTEEEKLVSFSRALDELKLGKKIAREGWNGKGMYLVLKVECVSWDEETLGTFPECAYKVDNIEDVEEVVAELPTICMKTADNKVLIGWLASQTDLLSNDWVILD